jgi:DNA-binding response OmpR family regulator
MAIIVAADDDMESAAGVLHDGDQLVPKPFTPAELREGVNAALRSTPAAA